MLKTLIPILQKFLHTFKNPVLFLNTSCQIESFNYNEAQQLEHYNNRQKLDEQSLGSTLLASFINNLKENRTLNVKNEKNNDRVFIRKKGIIPNSNFSSGKQQGNRTKDVIYSMFNDMAHGLIFINKAGYIVEMNETALAFLQCEKYQLIQKKHEVVFDLVNDYKLDKCQYLSSLSNYHNASISVSVTNEKNDRIYLKFETKFNYNLNLLVTTIVDETETILLKEQVEQQDSLKVIGQMAASIAHEIRNPMTSLKGFVQLLKVNSPDENQRYLRVIDSELDRMESILTELLDLSKPKEGSLGNFSILKMNDIVQIVEEVIELMKPLATQTYNRIEFENEIFTSESIYGNKNQLKQILINLIKNAIEVMPKGGEILVKLAHNQEGIQLSVIDNGPGISKESIELLFTPFYTTKDTGTGLGLPLVKKIIDEHKGSICVLSSLGSGTTFRVTLPIFKKEYDSLEERHLVNEWVDEGDVNSLPVI